MKLFKVLDLIIERMNLLFEKTANQIGFFSL